MQIEGSVAVTPLDGMKRRSASNSGRRSRAAASPLSGIDSDAAPSHVADLEDVVHDLDCAWRLPSGRTERPYWLRVSACVVLDHLDEHQQTLEQVERFEAGDDERYVVLTRQFFVFAVAHHRTDVAGGDEAFYLCVRGRP